MTSITQTIPHYTGGISQQPDEKKLPGQVVEAKNVLPDVTQGLLKRPGGKLIASLSDNSTAALNSNTNGRWFHYYRDEAEQYIGQVNRSGDINMWRCSDGYAMTVTNNLPTSSVNGTYSRNTSGVITVTKSSHGFTTDEVVNLDFTSGTAVDGLYKITSVADANTFTVTDSTTASTSGNVTITQQYLMHTTDEDIQSLTLNDYTYITNRTKTAAMATTIEPEQPYQAFVELKQVKYSSQYGLEIYNSTATSDLSTIHTATRLSVSYSQSDGGGSGALKTSGTCDSVGTMIFGPSQTNSSGSDPANRTNLAFRITTNGQPTTEGDSSAPIYKCRYMVKVDLLYGGEGWEKNHTKEVTMTTPVHNSNYTIKVEESSESKVSANLALVRPTPTSFDGDTVVTAESIVGAIRKEILTNSGFTVEQIGTGLYIKRTDAPFQVSTAAGELLNVLTDSVQDVADLPKQCKHGYVVKVRNGAADEDDYYVKFFGKDEKDGPGSWEECAAPGRTTSISPDTMPIKMVRTNATAFTVSQVAWDPVLVGTDVTAPEPSFIGNKINKMLFFRNRMVLLSDENVIMSQPGDFTNFWPKSAITFTTNDVIDISCSSEHPAIVYDGLQVNSGLILFTKTQQFMLTTDSDILSPMTAKINALANYNFNYKTSPVNLGTTIAFLDNAGKYSRFWEVSKIAREGEPDVIDQTKVVSKLFDQDLALISNSRENSVIFFSKKNSSTLYGFRYFTTNQRRMQQAWFQWELSGDIQHHAVLDDSLYVVVRNKDKDVMQKFSLKLDDAGYFINDDKGTINDATDDITYRIHLDNSTTVASSGLSYSAANDETSFSLPTGFNKTSVAATYTRSAYTVTVTLTGHGLNVDDSVHLNFTSPGSGAATTGIYKVKTVADANTFTVTDTVTGTISSSNVKVSYGTLAVFVVPTGTDTTFQGFSIDAIPDDGNVKLKGNWKTYLEDENDPATPGDPRDDTTKTPANNLILGYQFDMEVKLPTIYNTQVSGDQAKAFTGGTLVIHRLKMNFGPAGLYSTTINRTGKPAYTETWEPPIADSYGANRVQVNELRSQTIPVYEKNKNLSVTLKSTHPTPATLYSMTWEGDFTTNYYQRV